jgi:hypothetical protein
MLELQVSDITQNQAGPVVHATEPSGGEAKLELYLPQGYDTPSLGDRLVLGSAADVLAQSDRIETLEKEIQRLKAFEPTDGKPATDAQPDPLPSAGAPPSSDTSAETAKTEV